MINAPCSTIVRFEASNATCETFLLLSHRHVLPEVPDDADEHGPPSLDRGHVPAALARLLVEGDGLEEGLVARVAAAAAAAVPLSAAAAVRGPVHAVAAAAAATVSHSWVACEGGRLK